jgi:G3E family GTPase
VDALCGLDSLGREAESVKQVAVADRLVVTKTDLADRRQVRALEARLQELNPMACVLEAAHGEVEPEALLGGASVDLREVPAGRAQHVDEVNAFAVVFDQPLDWTAFGVWLTMLLQARGQDVLRVKGLLDVGGPGPLLVNGVQHVVHAPAHLDAWPDDDRRSRLVFIARDSEPSLVEDSLRAFSRPRS